MKAPTNLQEYGATEAAAIFNNYLAAWAARKPFQRAALLTGPPGSGKSTLVQCGAATYGAEVVSTNASGEFGKEAVRRLLDAALTESAGKLRIIFLDEVDALTTSQQKSLLSLIKQARCPVVLAANDRYALEREVRQACLDIATKPPNQWDLQRLAKSWGVPVATIAKARSYREARNLVEGAPVGEQPWAPDYPAKAALYLKGHETLTTQEQQWLCTWLVDNTTSPNPGLLDLWAARARTMPGGGKYLRVAARCTQVQGELRWPWSLGFAKPVAKATSGARTAAKKPRTKTAPEPPAETAAPPKPAQKAAPASDFF